MLALSQDPLQLRSAKLGTVQLLLGHQFRLVEESRKDWHVSTIAYRYHLLDGNSREIAAWHWHPGTGTEHPHLHVSGTSIDRRAHLPTGRVSIESIIRLLLTDMEVQPARGHADDYLRILEETERLFIQHRRWHSWRRAT